MSGSVTKRRGATTRLRASLCVACLCLACAWAAPAAAQSDPQADARDPNRHQRIPAGFAEGQTIEQVYVHLLNPGPDDSRNGQLRTQIENTFSLRPGSVQRAAG